MNERILWLIEWTDDTFRVITCYGVFDSPTTENTLSVLQQGLLSMAIPNEILIDPGAQFVTALDREHAHHTVKEFLDKNRIKHMVVILKHP